MYKPPDNCNRVKSIKSKFENIQKIQSTSARETSAKDGARSNVKETKTKFDATKNVSHQTVAKQLSDPTKRNIKRTPAFRIDKNAEKNGVLQRNSVLNRSHQLRSGNTKCNGENSVLKTSDIEDQGVSKSVGDTGHIFNNKRPILIKSKSSHDFAYIRNKFNSCNNNNSDQNGNSMKQRGDDLLRSDIALLYTEPIPKSLRIKNAPLTDIEYINISKRTSSNCDIYNTSTLKLSDIKSSNGSEETTLTDTLKNALRRPLPQGPPPKKPPRLFLGSPVKTSTFEEISKDLNKKLNLRHKPPAKKSDPKTMLNKLEDALRNNKLRSKKRQKIDISTTSGEDSDDSLLFKSKNCALPPTPDRKTHIAKTNSAESILSPTFNLNCLHSLSCSASPYERVKGPCSSFFLDCPLNEPVYAEPFHHINECAEPRDKTENKNIRNSLYYMSSPVLCSEERPIRMSYSEKNEFDSSSCDVASVKDSKQVSNSENSSLSSFTSDSAISTPMEERKTFENSPKIKHLIEAFESKSEQRDKSTKRIVDENEQNNRVDNLKTTLQKTLDKCFSNESNSESERTEKAGKSSEDEIYDKFSTYVKRVSKYNKCSFKKVDTLFFCCLIVEWNKEVRQIKFKFPYDVDIPHKIEDLCFPEATSGPLDRSNKAQCYSLVITDDKGERTFGYCRRVMPEGSHNCLPLAYCILSKHRAPRFYTRILEELESRHGIPDRLRDKLINKFYNNKFPLPGESVKIDLSWLKKACSANVVESNKDSLDLNSYVFVNNTGQYGTLNKADKEKEIIGDHVDRICVGNGAMPNIIQETKDTMELIMTLHHDSRYENADLRPLHTLSTDILHKIFASLLLERKVILVSCVISKLSSCVESLQTILYPFSWPHTFIPILPQTLWDVVESPTPVICGVLSVAVVNQYKIEHGIVVDLDEGSILIEEGDEDKILSSYMLKSWKKSIALAKTIPPEDYVHSVYLSDAYLQVFIVCLKDYKNFIVDGTFQKENFIRNGKTKGIRRFLKWFTDTTMFLTFIDLVIAEQDFMILDKKIALYGSEESSLILDKLLEWKR